eukprot:COSAG01_NODE_6200_length_3797_cov_318.655760_5_plen_194_part_00
MRRLRCLAATVAGAAAAPHPPWSGSDPFTSRGTNEPDDYPMPSLPHKLAQDAAGRVEQWELDELAARETEAAARRDYRLAAQLRDLQETLRPRIGGPMTLAECMAPATTSERYEFFLRHGFCVIPQAVDPKLLARMQPAWRHASVVARRQWEADKVGGEGVSGLYQRPISTATVAILTRDGRDTDSTEKFPLC